MALAPTSAVAKMRNCNRHGGKDGKIILRHQFFPLPRFLVPWPVREASDNFAAETRMEINLTDSEIVVAVAPI